MISTMACVIGGFILIWKLSKDVIATLDRLGEM
jgi:hypothetical protein